MSRAERFFIYTILIIILTYSIMILLDNVEMKKQIKRHEIEINDLLKFEKEQKLTNKSNSDFTQSQLELDKIILEILEEKENNYEFWFKWI